jgi:ribosomal protein S1
VPPEPRPGEVVEGIVVGVDDDGLLVNVGAEVEAVLPLGEVPQSEVLRPGTTVLAHVIDGGGGGRRVVLSFLLRLSQTSSQTLAEREKSEWQWRRGDIAEGVVVGVEDDRLLVDIKARHEAVVPLSEIPQSNVPGVGEKVVAYVLSGKDREGRVVLSLTRSRAERGWRNVWRRFQEGQTVEGDVVEHNSGGLVVNVEGVRGFVPLSQIVDLYGDGQSIPLSERLAAMLGRTLTLKVIEMNRRRNRLILSERAALTSP